MNKMTKDQKDIYNTQLYYLYLTLLVDLHYKIASFILYAIISYPNIWLSYHFIKNMKLDKYFIITFVGENV